MTGPDQNSKNSAAAAPGATIYSGESTCAIVFTAKGSSSASTEIVRVSSTSQSLSLAVYWSTTDILGLLDSYNVSIAPVW